jgi:hypothetical protein
MAGLKSFAETSAHYPICSGDKMEQANRKSHKK